MTFSDRKIAWDEVDLFTVGAEGFLIVQEERMTITVLSSSMTLHSVVAVSRQPTHRRSVERFVWLKAAPA